LSVAIFVLRIVARILLREQATILHCGGGDVELRRVRDRYGEHAQARTDGAGEYRSTKASDQVNLPLLYR
jgi:hypothetical protein